MQTFNTKCWKDNQSLFINLTKKNQNRSIIICRFHWITRQNDESDFHPCLNITTDRLINVPEQTRITAVILHCSNTYRVWATYHNQHQHQMKVWGSAWLLSAMFNQLETNSSVYDNQTVHNNVISVVCVSVQPVPSGGSQKALIRSSHSSSLATESKATVDVHSQSYLIKNKS